MRLWQPDGRIEGTMSTKQELMAKLAHESFREKVENWSTQLLSLAETADVGHLEGFNDLVGNWTGAIQLAFDVHGSALRIFDSVIAQLPAPQIVTAEELSNAFEVYLES